MISSIKSAKQTYQDIDKFLESLCSKKIDIDLLYESDYVNNQPTITIFLNEKEIHTELCSSSNRIFLSVPTLHNENVLKITMTGKVQGGTLIENGSIIKDTYIKFLGLCINKYSLLDDYDFFYKKFLHQKEDGTFGKAMGGLWSNSSLILEFVMPFDIWYNNTSNKNCVVSDTLKHREANNLQTLIDTLEKSVMKLK